MGKCLRFLVLTVTLVLAGAAPPRAAELLSTHPSHYSKPAGGSLGSPSATANRTRQALAGSRVVVRDEGALLERWILNTELSRACNQRLFRQRRDNFLVGQVDGRTYGAAVGGHGSLIDRANMAENQVVYLFRGQGTTNCRVYHRGR